MTKFSERYPASGSASDPKPNDGPQYPDSPNVLGVDLAVLTDLSQALRGRTIAALETLAEARKLGNKQAEDTAAAALAAVIAETQKEKNAEDVQKFFTGALKKNEPNNADAMLWHQRREGMKV